MEEIYGFQGLERSDPLKENLAKAALEELREMLIKRCDKLRGYLLTRNGRVVDEYYCPPYQKEDKVWVYSVSKAFTATAVGLAADQGLIRVEDKVVDFFPDKLPDNPGENLKKMRVRDLLTMSTGHGEDTGTAVLTAEDGDWVRAFLKCPVVHEPGTYFCYNSGATYILSAILRKVTGMGLVEYLKPRLFQPLGFDEVLWDQSPAGIEAGGWGLKVRLEDLAKLGELYLQKGMFHGKRIFSSRWAEEASGTAMDNSRNNTVNADWKQGYGYQMWRGRHNTFRADGAVGQFCIVMPDQNAVLTVLSETDDMQKVLDGVWETLLPALNASLTSDLETQIHQQRYDLEDNDRGFTGIQFCFEKGELELALSTREQEYCLQAAAGEWKAGRTAMPIGHSSLVPYFSLLGREQEVSAHYEWRAANELEISLVWRESPHREKIRCTFQEKEISILCPPNASAANIGIPAFCMKGRLSEEA